MYDNCFHLYVDALLLFFFRITAKNRHGHSRYSLIEYWVHLKTLDCDSCATIL